MTMTEGEVTKYFDLVRGKWRINASLPGYKVVGCAVEGLRRRPVELVDCITIAAKAIARAKKTKDGGMKRSAASLIQRPA